MRWIKRIAIALGSIVVVLVAIALIVPMIIPTDTYKEQIVALVKRETGRDLKLGGDLRLSVLPSVGLVARDVSFANRPGATGADMIRLKEFEFKLKLGPLLSGRFEIETLVLHEPVIELQIDKAGTANWVFEKPAGAPPAPARPGAVPPSPAPPASQAPKQGFGAELFHSMPVLSLRIVNGSIRYADERSGQRYEVAKINLDIALPGGDKPFNIAGDIEYRGKKLEFRTNVDTPVDFLNGQPTKVSSEFGLDLAKFSFAGTLQGGAAPKLAGPLKIEVRSVRELAAWAGSPLPAGKVFGPFSLAATVTGAGEALTLGGLTVKFDDITATGDLSLALAGAVPTLRGALSIPALDVNPYLSASAPGTPAAPPPSPRTSPGPGTPPGTAQPGTAPPAAAPPPDAAAHTALRGFAADVKLDIRNVQARQFRVDQAQLGLRLAGGVLAVALEKVSLYRGTVTGTVTVNAARAPATVAPAIQARGLDAGTLLVALGAGDRLLGTLSADTNLTATGLDGEQIKRTLGGTMSFSFANGALKGYNLAGMFRALGDIRNPLEIVQAVQRAVAALDRYDGAQRTDFSELAASFRCQAGTCSTGDLRLAAPLIRVEGRGSIAVAANAMDMLLSVKAVPSLGGQGSEFAKLGIPIPLRVRGPFASLSWSLDEKAFGDDLRRRLPELLKEQLIKNPGYILKNPGDILKRPGGILDRIR